MTRNFHTPIINGDPRKNDAAIWNGPLGTIDDQLSDNSSELEEARGSYPSIGSRFDSLVLAGGNVATLTRAPAAGGQKVVTVDNANGFIPEGRVAYMLANGMIEYNTIATVGPGAQFTLGANINPASGGIPDDTLITMISESEYQAAQAMVSGGTASTTLPTAVEWLQTVINVKAFGAFGDGASHPISAPNLAVARAQFPLTHAAHVIVAGDEYDWCAIQEAWLSAFQAGSLVENVYIPAGSYKVNRTIVGPFDGVGHRITVMGANARGTILSGTTITAIQPITLFLIPGMTTLRDLYLIGSDKSNAASIAVRIGGKTSAGDPWEHLNCIHCVLDGLRFGVEWYRYVSALYEVDQLHIVHCGTSAPCGQACIYLNNSNPAGNNISPSAGVVIELCDFSSTNAVSGQSIYGVYLMATEGCSIRNSTIRGYDHIIYMNGDSGIRNDGLIIEGVHTEINQGLKLNTNRWTPGHVYTPNTIIRPHPAAANGWWYKCTTAGTSAANSLRNANYIWTASTSGTNEYYVTAPAGGTPGLTIPHGVTANDVAFVRGWAGRLALEEWAWADNDSLGFLTIYVRLADNANPHTKALHYVWSSNNEPVWPTTYGATSPADGTVVWTAFQRSVFLETAVASDVTNGGLSIRTCWSEGFVQFISHGQSNIANIIMEGCTVRSCDIIYAQNYTAVRPTLFMNSCRLMGSLRPYPALNSSTQLTAMTMRYCYTSDDLIHCVSNTVQGYAGVSNFYTGEPNYNQGGWVYRDDANYTVDPVNDHRVIVNAGITGTPVTIKIPRLGVTWWQQGLRGKQITIVNGINSDTVIVSFDVNERLAHGGIDASTIKLSDIGDSVTIVFDSRGSAWRWFVLGSYGLDTALITESGGNVGIGTGAPAGKLDIVNADATAAPVLMLRQLDVSEEMIELVSTTGLGNAIEAAAAKVLTTTHFMKVTVNGTTRYIPMGTIA